MSPRQNGCNLIADVDVAAVVHKQALVLTAECIFGWGMYFNLGPDLHAGIGLHSVVCI